jgi:hypothetical protein
MPEHDETEYIDVVQFHAPGQHIAARLDIMGITPALVSTYQERGFQDRDGIVYDEDFVAGLDDDLREYIKREKSFLISLPAQDWIAGVAYASEGSFQVNGRLLATSSGLWIESAIGTSDSLYGLFCSAFQILKCVSMLLT